MTKTIEGFLSDAEYLGSPGAEAMPDSERLTRLILLAQKIPQFISLRDRELRDIIMGLIVKNSTGFDTIGNRRLWNLDIDAFEKELGALSTHNKENER